ncbi:hypothetical protein, partial [Oceanispirochaeta sp.]|uniref:hypothetical protein n=1 Tax=Oceanispirochaeta sp. TaxID=2035350 RepID=UPI002612255D
MININFNTLNPLEKRIHDTLSTYSKTVDTIRITQAAEFCGCSVSKISKFAKKLGFINFKQYLDFLYGKDLTNVHQSSELVRIQNFIADFDREKVEEMIDLINSHEKIV